MILGIMEENEKEIPEDEELCSTSEEESHVEGQIVDPKMTHDDYDLLISIRGDPDMIAKFERGKKKAHLIKKCWGDVAKELTERVTLLNPGSKKKFTKTYVKVI